MTSIVEHIGTTPGLADTHCCNCRDVCRYNGWTCEATDIPLRSDALGPIRSADCIANHTRSEREQSD